MWGMSQEEFYEYVKNDIKYSLPSTYRGAQIELETVYGNNDVILHALNITGGNGYIVPPIYLDDYFEAYSYLDVDVDMIEDEIAKRRMLYEDSGVSWQEIADYESAKARLQILLCDPKTNEEFLKDKVYSREGDFAAVYRLIIAENGNEYAFAPVTDELMQEWNVDLDTIRKDAILAEDQRTPLFTKMIDLLYHGKNADNLFMRKDGVFDKTERYSLPLALTNRSHKYAAGLILNGSLLDKVGEILQEDFYVLPSSIHEVAIMPENTDFSGYDLKKMISDINSNDVEPDQVLSDKLQHYDRARHELENLEVWKQRKEREESVAHGSDVSSRPSVIAKLQKARERVAADKPHTQENIRKKSEHEL